MKLKKVRTLPPVKLAGRIPGELHEELGAYASYYRTVHGEAIDVWPLLVQILRTFVEEDRGFQLWRRHPNGAAVGAPAGSGNAIVAESRNG